MPLDDTGVDPKVLEEVTKDVRRIGDNVKELKDSTSKDLADVRKLVEERGLNADTEAQVKALQTSILEKSDKLEKGFKSFEDRLDEVEKKSNRPRAGSTDELEERKTSLDFHRTSLALKGELKVSRPIDTDKVDYDAIKEYRGLFPMYLRRGFATSDMEQKLMLVGSDPDGGYLVTPEISKRIATVVYETSPMRSLANVETISTDAIEFPTDDGEAGAGWVGETEDRPETSTPQFGVQRIPVHELYAMPKATQKLLEDASINVETWLADKIGQKFARMEATAFVSGSGVKRPRGILTYPNATINSNGIISRGGVEQVLSGSVGAITADAFISMAFSLKEPYYANASWLMRRAVVPTIMLLKDTTNRYLWQQSLQVGQPSSLVGYPIYQAADMPAVATNALPVAFGDWKQAYTIVDRLGITSLRDPYTAKPFVLFYTRKRVGGDVTNFEAYKVMKVQ
jgi:HK97 family phage major capsid protein